MIGKLDPEVLARVLSRTGARDDSVVMGPQYGEDAAAMRVATDCSSPVPTRSRWRKSASARSRSTSRATTWRRPGPTRGG
nr:hypothetical protein [Halorussus sp. MSC15.2]